MRSMQPVRDAAEPAQALQALGHQVDLVIAAHLADRHLPVRVGVEERVPGVAAGERLPGAQVLGRLGQQRLPAPVDGRCMFV